MSILSNYRVQAGWIHTAGQVGIDPDTGELAGDPAGQIRNALRNLKAAVEEAGGTLETVVQAKLYLVDRSDFPAMNEIYAEFFTEEPRPARTTIITELASPDWRFEIEAVARVAA